MNILIVESLYHPDVTAALVDSATAALETGGARFERVAMPSLLEIPATIALAVRSRRYDGYVALGSVTGAHAQTFYTETMRALLTLGTAGTVIGNGIVMATDEGTAHDLAVRHDIGGDAARACLSLAVFAERLG